MKDTDKSFCSTLFDILELKGVRDVVCSPGSRNAPLLIAASARDNLTKHVVIDERTAAFMALGMAEVSRRPVALVCTSGTALLNYSPAVAEAFYKGIPLIVISADRPLQWIDQDDSQTLRQFEALSNFVKGSYELPSWGNDDAELNWYANRIVNDACCVATTGRKGPVHINVRLSEPLGHKRDREWQSPRVIDMLKADGISNKEVIRELAAKVAGSKILFVAGFLPPDSRLHKACEEFCGLPNVAVMTETISNLHLDSLAHSVDSTLTAYDEKTLDEYAPDIVISTGGSLVSRKLKEYLRRNRHRCEHWSLGWHHTTSDCFMSLTKRLEADPARLLHQFAAIARKKGIRSEYSALWSDMKRKACDVKDAYVLSAPWSEMKAYEIMFSQLPQSANLYLSNGTAIRYAQILQKRNPHASYCNRGVSGIDGSTSTAIGGAKRYKGITILMSGDMSMAYDVGALALPDIPDTMKIVVVDNAGGGIFRFIPSTSGLDEREEYFCCRPNLPLKDLARGYGWGYREATSPDELRESFIRMMQSERKEILRIVCDGELSAAILKEYMKIKV